jgi:putative FmdB family regulatory protein
MPIYGYACKNCDHTMDALQKMNDEALLECPDCGEPALKRLLSAPRFRLKGQGWYETDFKKDNQRNISKSDAQTETKPEKKEKSSGTESTVKPTATAKPADSKKAKK